MKTGKKTNMFIIIFTMVIMISSLQGQNAFADEGLHWKFGENLNINDQFIYYICDKYIEKNARALGTSNSSPDSISEDGCYTITLSILNQITQSDVPTWIIEGSIIYNGETDKVLFLVDDKYNVETTSKYAHFANSLQNTLFYLASISTNEEQSLIVGSDWGSVPGSEKHTNVLVRSEDVGVYNVGYVVDQPTNFKIIDNTPFPIAGTLYQGLTDTVTVKSFEFDLIHSGKILTVTANIDHYVTIINFLNNENVFNKSIYIAFLNNLSIYIENDLDTPLNGFPVLRPDAAVSLNAHIDYNLIAAYNEILTTLNNEYTNIIANLDNNGVVFNGVDAESVEGILSGGTVGLFSNDRDTLINNLFNGGIYFDEFSLVENVPIIGIENDPTTPGYNDVINQNIVSPIYDSDINDNIIPEDIINSLITDGIIDKEFFDDIVIGDPNNDEFDDVFNPDFDDLNNPDFDDLNNPEFDDLNNPDFDDLNNPDFDDVFNPDFDDLNNPEFDDVFNPDFDDLNNPDFDDVFNPDFDDDSDLDGEFEFIDFDEFNDNPDKTISNDNIIMSKYIPSNDDIYDLLSENNPVFINGMPTVIQTDNESQIVMFIVPDYINAEDIFNNYGNEIAFINDDIDDAIIPDEDFNPNGNIVVEFDNDGDNNNENVIIDNVLVDDPPMDDPPTDDTPIPQQKIMVNIITSDDTDTSSNIITTEEPIIDDYSIIEDVNIDDVNIDDTEVINDDQNDVITEQDIDTTAIDIYTSLYEQSGNQNIAIVGYNAFVNNWVAKANIDEALDNYILIFSETEDYVGAESLFINTLNINPVLLSTMPFETMTSPDGTMIYNTNNIPDMTIIDVIRDELPESRIVKENEDEDILTTIINTLTSLPEMIATQFQELFNF